MSDASSRSSSSSCCRNVNGDVLCYRIVPSSPVLYVPGDLNSLLTIQVHVRQWLTAHHPSKVSGGEGPVEDPEGGLLDAYEAAIDGEGDWELSKLTGALTSNADSR